MPTDKPIPMIGPIKGEMSMAPIITAVELTFKPNEAMKIAKISTQRFAPWKVTPLLICLINSVSFSLSGNALKYPLMFFQSDSLFIVFLFGGKYTNKNADLLLLFREKPIACNAFALKSLRGSVAIALLLGRNSNAIGT